MKTSAFPFNTVRLPDVQRINQHDERRQRFLRLVQVASPSLETWVRSPGAMAPRAQSILLAGQGLPMHEIVHQTGLSENAVRRYRRRFELWGLNGLLDPRPR